VEEVGGVLAVDGNEAAAGEFGEACRWWCWWRRRMCSTLGAELSSGSFDGETAAAADPTGAK